MSATGGASTGAGGSGNVPAGYTLLHITYVAPGPFTVVEVYGIATDASRNTVLARPQPIDSSGSTSSRTYAWGTLWDGTHAACLAESVGKVTSVSCDVIVPANALIRLGPHYYTVPDNGKMTWATESGALAGSLSVTGPNGQPVPWHIAGPYTDHGLPSLVVELTSPPA